MVTQTPATPHHRMPKPNTERPIRSQNPDLDPVLQGANVVVEQEELVDPDEVAIKGKPTRLKIFKFQISRYGNRVLASGKNFVMALSETVAHIVTALAGSILLLPLVIIVRGLYVLLNTVFSLIKPVVLSIFRGIFDLLRSIIWPLHEIFITFNKQILFPSLKRIKEDDTSALVAFGVLVILIISVVVVLNVIF